MGFDGTGDERDGRGNVAGGRQMDHGASQRSADDMTVDGQRLRDLAEKLEGRGLSSRLVTYSGEQADDELIAELIVTNPADRERGIIRIGDDGAITWEFFGDLSEAGAGRLLDEATNALRARGMRIQRDTRLNGAGK